MRGAGVGSCCLHAFLSGWTLTGPPALHLFIWSGQFLDSMTQIAILVRPIKKYFNLA
jgi:hypothetical protein